MDSSGTFFKHQNGRTGKNYSNLIGMNSVENWEKYRWLAFNIKGVGIQ